METHLLAYPADQVLHAGKLVLAAVILAFILLVVEGHHEKRGRKPWRR